MSKDIPVGYKLTEVGVIPEDWEVKRIKEIAPLQRGFDLPVSTQKAGKYPVVYSNGITSFHNSFTTKAPGVVTGRSGTLGKVHYVENDYWAHNTTLWVTNFFSNYPLYIYYLYSSLKLERFGSGSGVPTLNRNDVHDYFVAIPQSTEQEAIALVLSDTDALITSLDKLIAKKRDIKQAAMQQLLTGKQRLEGFGDSSGNFKQTEIGLIPEDWEVKPLSLLGTSSNPVIKAGPFGSSLTKDTYVLSGYKVYGQEQVIRGDYTYGDYFINSDKYKELQSCAVKAGDILLSLVGTTGKVLVIPENAPEGIINPRLIRFSFDRKVIFCSFFKELFESNPIQSRLSQCSQGGTMGVLNASMLRPFYIQVPPLEEQQAIAKVLSDMDSEISALEQRRDKTKALKQAMMQELLTGRIRLL